MRRYFSRWFSVNFIHLLCACSREHYGHTEEKICTHTHTQRIHNIGKNAFTSMKFDGDNEFNNNKQQQQLQKHVKHCEIV